ncbi:uncharacterized protein I206_106507 [Kwoniella pini CBS 10737]|uniref:Uncharacterized protein n=1 Tax=Kwoniella pini CBS 10737 TaxID=1296096 RepID=A0A1B9HUH9_9TREE|nr:uncharacterized protein I206_07312 [Kwoniella pini CBS 10737]OCF46925.1 hypothetical protein I206_07312 [Kwoniella pini CBS 10737]
MPLEQRITRSRTITQKPSHVPPSSTPGPSSKPVRHDRFWRRSNPNHYNPPNSPSVGNRVPSSPHVTPDINANPENSSELSVLSSFADQSASGSSAPTPAAIPSKAPNSARSDTHAKKKRKTSLPPTTISTPIESNFHSKAPSTSISNRAKAPRVSVTGHNAPTRSHKALLIRDSTATSRAGSQHVVEDDAPLPPPPPRTGMGEGSFPVPQQSNVREEHEEMRKEAQYIIQQSELKRQEKEKQREREHVNGFRPSVGKRNRKSINYNENDEDEDENVDMSDGENQDRSGVWEESRGGPGPSTSNSRNRRRDSGVNYENGNGERRNSTGYIHHSMKDQTFEEQFDRLQRYQRNRISAEKANENTFPKNAGAAIILAHEHTNGFAQRFVPRDRIERGYQQGMSGLSNEMEIDAQGFVDNVKDNLRAILKYYFPDHSPRRDAFCERIGRGLAQLGWELTDNADAALLP